MREFLIAVRPVFWTVVALLAVLAAFRADAAVTVETTAYRVNLGNANTINIGVIGTVPLGLSCKTDKIVKSGMEYTVIADRNKAKLSAGQSRPLQVLAKCGEAPPPPVDCVVSWPEWPDECPVDGVRTRMATVVTQPANGGAACPALTESQPCVSPPVEQWTHCADENGRCDFSGKRTVRYGASSQYATRDLTGGTECSNAVFGDPVLLVVKACELSSVIPPQDPPSDEPPPAPGNWPQPPMPGMPVVNAPAHVQLTTGKSGLILGTAGAVGGPGPDVGAFRLSCRPSHMSYDDPLLYPGAANAGRAHHHTFFGNDAVNAATNLDNLRNIGGSTCNGGSANKSAYWVPSMIDTRTGKPIVPYSIQAYYKSGYHDMPRESVQPFPVGLKILGGTPTAREPGGYIGHFHCHYDGGNSGPDISGPTIPACPYTPNPDPRWFTSGTTVWGQIEMPNCWDGRNLDSADHKSHVTSSKWHGNRCPASHPVLITTITFNILYPVNESDDTRAWKLSSDMGQPGTSFHADWINGWDEGIERVWLDNCVRAGRDCGSNNLGDGRGLDP